MVPYYLRIKNPARVETRLQVGKLIQSSKQDVCKSVQHLSLLEAHEPTNDITDMFQQLINNVGEREDQEFENEFQRFLSEEK